MKFPSTLPKQCNCPVSEYHSLKFTLLNTLTRANKINQSYVYVLHTANANKFLSYMADENLWGYPVISLSLLLWDQGKCD